MKSMLIRQKHLMNINLKRHWTMLLNTILSVSNKVAFPLKFEIFVKNVRNIITGNTVFSWQQYKNKKNIWYAINYCFYRLNRNGSNTIFVRNVQKYWLVWAIARKVLARWPRPHLFNIDRKLYTLNVLWPLN